MTAMRSALYVAGLTLAMIGLVAVERFTDAGLRLLVASPFTATLGTSEYSPVEWLQLALLAASAALAWRAAARYRAQRELSWLLLALAVIATCRELDLFLDAYLFDHAWQVAVALIVVITIVYGVRRRQALRVAVQRAGAGSGLALVALGIGVLVGFANVIGNEGLWRSLLGDGYQRVAKIAAEEFSELVGYWLWLVGQIEYTLACRRQHRLGGDAGREQRRRRGRRQTTR